jgi:short-chain fatty acids transporter
VPSSFSIAAILTILTYVLAITVTNTSPLQAVVAWGDGFWELLSFAMQMSLVMVSGYMIATSPPADRLLSALASVPRGPRSAVAWMAFLSMGLGLLNWGLSIVTSAVMVRRFARHEPRVDYRLLVTAAYLGMGFTWHAGLSASAPLLVATPKHFMEKEIGLIPLTQTIFSPFNIGLAALVLVVFTVLVPLLHPKPGKALTVHPETLADRSSPETDRDVMDIPQGRSFARWLDDAPLLGWLLALAGVVWLLQHFSTKGWAALTLNVVNFLFLVVAFALHGRPSRIVAAAEGGVRLISGVVLQFPLYAGIYGIIKGSGLAEVIGHAFVSVATPHTYPLLVYWYSGIVNYFVPSGGSKWAIEAPYVLAAGETLHVATPKVVLAYAWGDMMTDLIQPFWALPLLRAARLDFRHILGYAMLLFLIYAVMVSVCFWLFAR